MIISSWAEIYDEYGVFRYQSLGMKGLYIFGMLLKLRLEAFV